ncbi:hypothetical protein HK096_003634 [Nowakowskiella sp. JEL0078]|nr:hypothetical protein HK096_003634 [Nowakowskiella sp. JEL0078]
MKDGTPCSSCGKKTNVFKMSPAGGSLICWSCYQQITKNKKSSKIDEKSSSNAKIEPTRYSNLLRLLIPEFEHFPKKAQLYIRSSVKTWILKNYPERFSECVITVNDNNTYGIPIDLHEQFMKWAKEQNFDRVPGMFPNDVTGNLPAEYYHIRSLPLPVQYQQQQLPSPHLRTSYPPFDPNPSFAVQYQNGINYQPSPSLPPPHFYQGPPPLMQFHGSPSTSFGTFIEPRYSNEIQHPDPRFDGFKNEGYRQVPPTSQNGQENQNGQYNK